MKKQSTFFIGNKEISIDADDEFAQFTFFLEHMEEVSPIGSKVGFTKKFLDTHPANLNTSQKEKLKELILPALKNAIIEIANKIFWEPPLHESENFSWIIKYINSEDVIHSLNAIQEEKEELEKEKKKKGYCSPFIHINPSAMDASSKAYLIDWLNAAKETVATLQKRLDITDETIKNMIGGSFKFNPDFEGPAGDKNYHKFQIS